MAKDYKTAVDESTQNIINANQAHRSILDGLLQQSRNVGTKRELTSDVPVTTYQDLHKQMFEVPISKAEEERRINAANHISAVQNLGNAFNAFSNLVFTGNGAPSQTLPKIENPNIRDFADRARNARQSYADSRMKYAAMDDAINRQNRAERKADIEYNDKIDQQRLATEMSIAGKMAELDRDNANAALNAAKLNQEADNTKFSQDMQMKQYGLQVRTQNRADKTLELNNKHKNAQLELQRQRLEAKTNRNVILDDIGMAYNFNSDTSYKGLTELSNIANHILKTGYKPDFDTFGLNTESPNGQAAIYQKIISGWMANEPENPDKQKLIDKMKKAGILTLMDYQPVDDSESFSLDPEKQNDANNGFSYKPQK